MIPLYGREWLYGGIVLYIDREAMDSGTARDYNRREDTPELH